MTGEKRRIHEDLKEDLSERKKQRTIDESNDDNVAGKNDSPEIRSQLSSATDNDKSEAHKMLTDFFPVHSCRAGTLHLPPEEECVEELKKIHDKVVELENNFSAELDQWKAKYWEETSRDEHNEDLEKKFCAEKAAWEEKYQERYEPLYRKRYEIVNGLSESDQGVSNEEEAPDGNKAVTKQKGVACFWIKAMIHHYILADVIKLHDEKALECLTDIKCRKLDNPKGFELDFIFDPETNPHFKNPVLTKKYHGEMERTIGTEIKWCTPLDECCLTREYKIRRKVLKSKNRESFFNLFNSTPAIDEPLPEGVIPQDYAIGLTIRNKIIPHAISWYNRDEYFDDYEYKDEENELEIDEFECCKPY